MMDAVIELIKEEHGKQFEAKFIWKTTTAMQKWKYGDPKSNARHNKVNRFLTSPVSTTLSNTET